MSSKSSIYQPLTDVDASENEDYYFQMIANLPAAVYTCDAKGYIKFYNKSAAYLWGREPEIGKDLWCGSWKIYKPDGTYLPLDQCPMAVTLKEKRAVSGEEIVVERPNGERRNILPHPQPIINSAGKMIGAMNMLIDITENKQTQEINQKLKQYNDQLEEFAYAASHDLQEPLRKINTFSSLLFEKYFQLFDEAGKKHLSKITESSKRMMTIISDLLAYTHETKVQGQLVPTDLNKVIENIKSDLELMILEKKASISHEPLPVINVVPSLFNRLFYNLINNSLKFSKKDVPPEITITHHRSDPFIEIVVQDNGIGFDQVYAERIFHLFQRLNDKHTYTGNGIGLSLCKKIVENHGGQIFAVSEANKGAAFHIKLPSYLLV